MFSCLLVGLVHSTNLSRDCTLLIDRIEMGISKYLQILLNHGGANALPENHYGPWFNLSGIAVLPYPADIHSC